jgi:hypothetical protein
MPSRIVQRSQKSVHQTASLEGMYVRSIVHTALLCLYCSPTTELLHNNTKDNALEVARRPNVWLQNFLCISLLLVVERGYNVPVI